MCKIDNLIDFAYVKIDDFAFLIDDINGVKIINILNVKNQNLYLRCEVVRDSIIRARETNFSNTNKYKAMWLLERNKQLFLDYFNRKGDDEQYYIVSRDLTSDCRDIRIEVFVDEQGFEEEFDELDSLSYHVALYVDKKPVATGRTFEKSDGVFKFGRIAVKKHYRGRDYGMKIIEQLEKVAKDNGAKKTVLSSQYHAKGFYEKCGYIAVGEPYLEENAKHIYMEKICSF